MIAALVVALGPRPAAAQKLALTVTPSTIAFPAADPDAVPVISSAPVTIDVRVQQNAGQPWNLTILAAGDLLSGPSKIDIGAVTWTVTPSPPFINGTLSRTSAQPLASGIGNALGRITGTLTFRLANSWTYDAGTYTQALVFTLSAP